MQHIYSFLNPVISQERFLYLQTLLTYLIYIKSLSISGSMGCANYHPITLDFKYKKRWYVLENHFTSVFTRNCNTTDNNEEEYLSKITSHDLS
ncbi:hypothetical protein PR048_023460 [Dryococelus australis]|uniref:Uncharacterized protein n=1 Tax=Dryococelus australis TaxID=614101 RepID=A0ABQ9GU89_9NEOP|nr:hypothetical protein PR048_023460 [Dryococelus australis]